MGVGGLSVHAGNTQAEVEGLAASICQWAQEMLDMDESETSGCQ